MGIDQYLYTSYFNNSPDETGQVKIIYQKNNANEFLSLSVGFRTKLTYGNMTDSKFVLKK